MTREERLRTCIECGLCLPHCATYLATGNETLSPRGRLLLLRSQGTRPLESSVREALDLCLGCFACVSACPSGVQADLLRELKDLAARRAGLAIDALDRPRVLAAVKVAGRFAAGMMRLAAGPRWRQRLARAGGPARRLARLVGSLPASPDRDRDLVRMLDRLVAGRGPSRSAHLPGAAPSAAGAAPPTVALFDGCADATLLPGTARRLRQLLSAAGCRLHAVSGQDCCGALAAHTARPHRQAGLRERNQHAFASSLPVCDHVVVAAAGCSYELKDYAAPLGPKVIDAAVLLDRLSLPELAAVPLRVAVHDACHARHGQGIVAEPRRLLARIPGLVICEPGEADVCCGGAGGYALQHPEFSARMGRRKAAALAATGCDLVVTTNPGCLGQIADGLAQAALPVPIVPLSDLIWYAWRKIRV